MQQSTQCRMGKDEKGGSAYKMLILVVAVSSAVVTVGFCIWNLNERVSRNDYLLREARFLAAAYQRWQERTAAKVEPALISYTVNHRHGTVVLINEEVIVEGQQQVAMLGWTNSSYGPGTLIITSSNLFLWRDPSGATRRLNIPDFCRVPWWWYLTTP